ncbi:MAG TPA: DUF1501 domain-containing protein [Polyangiaceae bacterium]|nr:DUF1501 domain-containing protein [Polyangiaceae bacterium]
MKRSHPFTRRALMSTVGAGTAAWLAQASLPAAHAESEGELPLFVFAYFEGGWDTLLGLDPRDEQIYGNPGGSIHTGYAGLAQNDPGLAAVLADHPNGLIQPPGSNIVFGPAMAKLSAHFQDLCVVRGIDMGTLTHEVGRRYFLTGKFPRGLLASGSALPTWVVHDTADRTDLPNLVTGGNETYNEGLDPAANGVSVRSSQDLFYLMNRIDPDLPGHTRGAIDAFAGLSGCLDTRLDGNGCVHAYRASRAKAARLASGDLWQHFAFTDTPTAEIQALFDHFGVAQAEPGALLAMEQAATAAQALKYGVSQAVSIELARGIDDHDDSYQTDHAPALRYGFDAAERLIAFLKDEGLWARTTLILWSEFARTPRMNARDGRDHHLWSSCLVAGRGIRGNNTIGATTDTQYAGRPVDLASGAPNDAGHLVRPADIHATVLQAMGLSYDHIENQQPKIVEAMLA